MSVWFCLVLHQKFRINFRTKVNEDTLSCKLPFHRQEKIFNTSPEITLMQERRMNCTK